MRNSWSVGNERPSGFSKRSIRLRVDCGSRMEMNGGKTNESHQQVHSAVDRLRRNLEKWATTAARARDRQSTATSAMTQTRLPNPIVATTGSATRFFSSSCSISKNESTFLCACVCAVRLKMGYKFAKNIQKISKKKCGIVNHGRPQQGNRLEPVRTRSNPRRRRRKFGQCVRRRRISANFPYPEG